MAENNDSSKTTTPQASNSIQKKKRWFGADIRIHTNTSPQPPNFDHALRQVMEPHVIKARKNRLEKQSEMNAKSIRVPYPTLRKEQTFSFDCKAYPLHRILAETLGTPDLSLLHTTTHTVQDKKKLMEPLLQRSTRCAFHECYDDFVTSFCVPYLHNLAMEQNIFNTNTKSSTTSTSSSFCATNITYRYQAFPCLRIVRPGEFSIGPHCDIVYGHSVGNINFHVPLTPVYGTNALYTESVCGKEDWHPMMANEVGLGFIFDGAQCLHFSLENTTETTRVSLDFRIAIGYDDGDCGDDDDDAKEDVCDVENQLCSPDVLKDRFEEAGPGYYDEVVIAMNDIISGSDSGVVVKKGQEQGSSRMLLDPDKRVGFPFR